MSPSFLGWDAAGWRAALPDAQPAPRSCLDAAAAWLLERFGPDLSGVVVAVPGKRAGRRLEELLVARAAADPRARALWPPEIVTAGALTDRMLVLERQPASRLLRTLTWRDALASCAPAALRRIVAQPPEPGDLPAWLALAEELRALHAALGAERKDLSDVAEVLERVPEATGRESARWAALAAVQADYRARLLALDPPAGDPHDLRRQAIEAGRIDRARRVVLVGVTEASGLLAACLDTLGEQVQALVFAPPARADDFDARGCVRTERWAAAELPLDPASWLVAEGPAEQAAAAVDTLGRWQDRHPVEDVTLGVPDTEVVPYLRARLAEQGVPARDAAGLELQRTPTLRALGALAGLLQRGRFADLAAAVRHPPLEGWLGARPMLAGRDLPALLDRYQAEHLPDRVPERLLEGGRDGEALAALQRELDALAGELAGGVRPLRLWVGPIAALLERLSGDRPLERESDRDHVQVVTLETIAEALLEIAALPPSLDASTSCRGGAALSLLLASLTGATVPPAEREPSVELLGWLELPLDDAPLILIGFNEGRVPEPLGGPALLHDELRGRLRLPDAEQRLARDAYALAAIAASGRALKLITGRRAAAGDALLPSRLLFRCPEAEIPTRLTAWLPRDEEQAPLDAAAGPAPAAAPRRPPLPRVAEVESMRVTAFKTYLASPYLFYLQCVQGLETVIEEHELSPMAFGSLVHEVLEGFGRDAALRASSDAAAIETFLHVRLQAAAAQRYGDTALPAVAVQLVQLRRRLSDFAAWQAGRTRGGWRIHTVEWSPPSNEWPFEVDGRPMRLRGRIDRIDVHADGRWALLDYKTSEREASRLDPESNHQRGGKWIDLQLPLYRLLAQPLAAEQGWTRPPELGYVVLPGEREQTRERMATWSEADLEAAWEVARQVVRDVRAGRFAELGDFPEDEPELAWIAGRGLLAVQAAAPDGDEEDES